MAEKKPAKKSAKNADKELLTRIRQRAKLMIEADQENRRDGLEDMKFVNVPGEQWDANMKKERGDRPCYEFNKLRVTLKRVINEMRSNRPAGKVRGVEDGDKKTAEIYEGLIRNIWNVSDGDTVIDYAAEYQVAAGMGSWRITTEYAGDDVFDQDIWVKPLQNPFCLYWDPSAKDEMKRDAMDCLLLDRISKTSYEMRWPNKEVVSWESNEFDDEEEWMDDESVRIVEYWWKEPATKELWQLATGEVIDSESEGAKLIDPLTIKRKRVAKCYKVQMCIASGDAILERADWAGKDLPFVTVYGEHVIIDGKDRWWGLPRFAKDAQRSYNVSRTAITETIALAPQAKWWATVEQAKGHTQKWAEAHYKNFPYLLYNADPKAPGTPQRMGGADVPVALIQESQIASDEIKAVTGIFDASLGMQGNETSGKAINAREQQGQIATFNFPDNMSKGIRRTWEICIDLIPKIYDTERQLRILGSDGAEDYARVNQVVTDPTTLENVTINDLSKGHYDVAVTTGPSFTTKRQEASETYLQLAQAAPQVMAVAGDLIFKSMDLPYSEDIADRLKAMLPPPIQELISKGKQIPPEAQAVMMQAQQAMAMVEQQMQVVQQAGMEAQKEQQAVEKGKAEIQTAVANLKAQEAQFEAKVAQELAKITQAQAQLQVAGATLQTKEAQSQAKVIEDGNAGERQQLNDQVAQAMLMIQQQAEQFSQQAAQVLAQIAAMATAPKPRLKSMKAKRVNGELIAEPVYEDAMI